METTINSRIEELIQALGINQKAFAESIAKTPTTIYTVVNGRNKPGYDVLEAILKKYPKINPDWLMKGEGEIWKVEQKSATTEADSYLREHLKRLEDNFSTLAGQLHIKDQQIISLTRMLEQALGKPNGVAHSQIVPVGKIIPLFPVMSEKKAV